MVQIEAITITELRGIRHLTVEPARKNFVIYGPNGSGKSGVVDAIQFGLTGKISRLTGKGTGGLALQKHGPHVDSRNNVAAAEVSLRLYFPRLNKTFVLKRNAKTAAAFTLDPKDSAARAIVEEMAHRPELTLSRREIIKYILVEAGERAKEIQALLRLDEITKLRSVLLTAKNQTETEHRNKRNLKEDAVEALRRHLELHEISDERILEVVNKQRRILELSEITTLGSDTTLDSGIDQGERDVVFNKVTALGDIAALQENLGWIVESGKQEVEPILNAVSTLENDPSLLTVFQQRFLIEDGLRLVDGPQCPLCDTEWEDEAKLRAHLQKKITQSKRAEAIEKKILDIAGPVAGYAQRIVALLTPVKQLAISNGLKGFADELSNWIDDLTAFARKMTSVKEVLSQRSRLEHNWLAVPDSIAEECSTLASIIREKPDQSSTAVARSVLTLAQDRLSSYRKAERAEKLAADTANVGTLVYETYCNVSEKHLTALYDAVEKDFINYYRKLNGDDESGFTAELEPSGGRLNLMVAFYGRGLFPPAAYHSEGHQDGMGVCLYLALMKRLMDEQFSLAVLDDVVMSIDRQHRKQFCRLLRDHFPDTQFIITTHDKVWAKQMQTEDLVASKNRINFHGWNVQTGPVFGQVPNVWSQLNDDLAKHEIGTAAARLRRHLEYVFAELADRLSAKVPYRADFTYDLGVLSDAVIGRHRDLLKRAAKSANSWDNDSALQEVQELQEARSKAMKKHGKEEWLINKAVHYNEWEDFSAEEFREVLEAFIGLLQQLRCLRCDSWLYVTPRAHAPEVLRCPCAVLNLNLK